MLEPDAHPTFRAYVRRFVATDLAPEVERFERDATLPRDVFRRFGEAGLAGLAVSSAWGGAARDFMHLVVVAEELAAARALSPAVSLLVAANTVCPLLDRHGSDGVRGAWLAPIARGECVAALAVTEDGGGSGVPHNVRTSARSADGGWVLDGEKAYITNAPIADVFLVLAATTPGAGPLGVSLFTVPARAPGVRVVEQYRKIGLHGSPTGRVRFDGVRLLPDAVVGRLHLGFAHLSRAMAGERVLIAAGAAALARSCVDELAAPLADDDSADGARRRVELWELRATVDACRAFVHRTACDAPNGDVPADRAYAAKATVVDACQRVIARCVELAGVEGLLDGQRWARAAADSRVLSVFAGTSDAMRDALAAGLAAYARSPGRPPRLG